MKNDNKFTMRLLFGMFLSGFLPVTASTTSSRLMVHVSAVIVPQKKPKLLSGCALDWCVMREEGSGWDQGSFSMGAPRVGLCPPLVCVSLVVVVIISPWACLTYCCVTNLPTIDSSITEPTSRWVCPSTCHVWHVGSSRNLVRILVLGGR
jgi:hypothetical protein